MWKLSEQSPTLSQPDGIKTPLRRHQLAMLHRCLSIEKKIFTENKVNFGVIADKAGAGKTAVIISLIMADKSMYKKTQNLIIVPQNIHTQWVSEFKKFSGDTLTVKAFIEYSDISTLLFNTDILKKYDVLITTIAYYDMISTILNQNGINIKRIIFDEIDTVSNIINISETKNLLQEKAMENVKTRLIDNGKPLGTKTKIKWFISASFDNSLTENGFTFGNQTIPLKNIREIMCKCEESFVDKFNFQLEEPETNVHKFDDIIDDYANLLSVIQMDLLNSLSFQGISSVYRGNVAASSKEALKIVVGDYFTHLERCKETLERMKLIDIENAKEADKKEIQKQITNLEKEKTFYNKLIDIFHKTKCSEECEDKLKCTNEKIECYPTKCSKVEFLKEYFQSVEKDEKILVFSDFTGTFKIISSILQDACIKHTELSGGNIKAIDKTIDRYKNQDYNVLMVDSSSEGCGMNLENTSCIIFVHKTSELLYNQIIGRAQRPGRKGVLKIICLYNQNEIV